MDNQEKDFVLSDEAIAEQEKTSEAGGTLRSEISKSIGLEDNEDNKEVIDKLVDREKDLRKGYGELLGKKYIPLKKAYQELEENLNSKSDSNKDFDPDEFRKQVQQETVSTLNEQFLEASDFSDEFKSKVREELNRNPGKPAQSILKESEYLQFYKEKEDKERKIQEASENGTGQKGTSQDGKKMPDKFNDPKFMATPEGQKEFDEWQKG